MSKGASVLNLCSSVARQSLRTPSSLYKSEDMRVRGRRSCHLFGAVSTAGNRSQIQSKTYLCRVVRDLRILYPPENFQLRFWPIQWQ